MSQVGQWQDTWPAGITATMNVTYTQANAAGGAIVCEISPGQGNELIVLAYTAINSGTNGILVSLETAVGTNVTITQIQSVGSGAGTSARASVGLVSTVTGTTNNVAGLGYPFIVSGTQNLRISQTAAGAQNDTMQVLVNIRIRGRLPDVTHASSVNPANVTATAGAESFSTV